jgi:hypothetical protein
MGIEDNVRSWVALDNQVRLLTEQLQNLRERRRGASDAVLAQAATDNVMSARVRVSDGYLRFARVKTSPPLSLKYVEECLTRCLADRAQIARIMTVVRDARAVREETAIKRVVQKSSD